MSTGKGKKRIKNQPVFYDEPKKGHQLMLTDSAWNMLKKVSSLNNVSASQYIEEIIRKLGVTVSAHDTISLHL